MTQSLLENTNTYLLNATADSSNYAKNVVKNYQETYTSNGKSFNDIFSNANDKFTNNTNKYLTKDSNRNNVADRNSNNLNKNSNNVQNNSQTVDKQSKFRESQENSRTMRENSQTKSQNEVDSKDTYAKDKDTVESSENVNDNLNSANEVSTDEELTAEDLEVLNQMLEEDLASEEDTADAELYINAYYQSTLDSLNTVDETAVDETTNLNTLADADVSTETTLKDALNELNTEVNAEDTLKTTADTKIQNVESKNGLKDNTLKSDMLAKSDEKGKVTAEKDIQQDIIEDNKKVEVDVKTDETSNMKDDVLVNVADDVVEQVKPLNVNNEGENKTSFREVMEKAGLDDRKLEALNMTITNSGSAGTDLSNGFQGSAQEDIAKMAVNGLNGKKNISEVANNKEFSKLVDTKNMQQEEPKEISKNDILAQISNKMQAKNINGQQRITLQLTPESLGKITIELSKGKDGLQAKMLTDNVQVRDMLEKNVDGLKSTLASQGVTVNNVSVKVASASETASEFDFGRENFNQQQTEQDFAGTGERGGERNSQYANENAPENAMNDIEMPMEETEIAMGESEEVELNPDAEKVLVGAGNVDIEV